MMARIKYSTLKHDKALAKQFELSRRRDNLDWGYHAAVAGLTRLLSRDRAGRVYTHEQMQETGTERQQGQRRLLRRLRLLRFAGLECSA